MVKQIASMVYFELELLKGLACNINNMDEKNRNDRRNSMQNYTVLSVRMSNRAYL